MDGIVKNFNESRGFGFITPLIGAPATTPDVFFHIRAVERPPGQAAIGPPIGARVSFDVVRSGDGRKQAANVRLQKVKL